MRCYFMLLVNLVKQVEKGELEYKHAHTNLQRDVGA